MWTALDSQADGGKKNKKELYTICGPAVMADFAHNNCNEGRRQETSPLKENVGILCVM